MLSKPVQLLPVNHSLFGGTLYFSQGRIKKKQERVAQQEREDAVILHVKKSYSKYRITSKR